MNRLSTIQEEWYEVEEKKMTTIVNSVDDELDIQPYSMHVSRHFWFLVITIGHKS